MSLYTIWSIFVYFILIGSSVLIVEEIKFLSVFTKSYGQKILLQTAIGAGLSGTVNFARKNDWSKYKPVFIVPRVPSYLLF